MKNKNVTKTKKLKLRIVDLESTLRSQTESTEYYKGKYEAIKERYERIEGTDKRVDREVQWLRDLVEMITIDASKYKVLEEMRKHRIGL